MSEIAEASPDLTEDAFFGGRLLLRQPKRGHRAGHDAMLLAAAAAPRAHGRVVEFGAGVGAAGLAVARQAGGADAGGIDLVLVEIDPMLADLARSNAALNGIAAKVVTLDVAAPPASFQQAGLSPCCADAVLMNPPFNASSRHRASPDAMRAAAHIDAGDTLGTWIHAARRILRPDGALTLIWRAEGLADVLAALARGFGEIVVTPVHSDPQSAAIRILVRATKGSRAPLALLPGQFV